LSDGENLKKQTLFTITAVLMLATALVFETQFSAPANAQSNGTVDGWTVRNQGGNYSESNGTIRIWSDTHDQGVVLYKEISPKSDFEFSLQVKAARMDGFGIVIGDIDTGRQMNFEFHNKYGTNTFLLARAVNETSASTGVYGTYWDWQGFAYGQENVWYTMKLTVQATPFVVTGQVYNENGVLLGKLSLSDMENFLFKDIQNVEIMNPWGGDYYVRNISDVTAIPNTPGDSGEGNSTQIQTFEGWNVINDHGYFTKTDGTWRIWSDAHDDGTTFYKNISSKTDFQFSLQIKANQIDGFGLLVGKQAFLNGSKEGAIFEFHNKYGSNTFLLARFVHTTVWETGQPGDIWDWQGFAYGQENTWYTMKLSVQAKPFKVTGEVFTEDGTSLETYSVSDMINLKFEDIQVIGFTDGWGGDYNIRNISDVSDIAANPSSDSNSNGAAQPQISIAPEISSTTLNTPINIKGKLSDSNGSPITNETVILSYSFPGIDGWLPISSAYTDAAGEYAIQWANTATGYFTLKAQWNGNSTFQGCSNTTTVNILPYKENNVFFVQSNSTVTALSFNSTSIELSFSVTGPSGTHGYTQVTIEKGLISNPQNLRVNLDSKQLEYRITKQSDSWVITLNYSHSTHEISMQFQPTQQTEPSQTQLFITGVLLAVFFAVLIAALVVFRSKKQDN
jgi:hypothetical protein